MYRRCHLDVFTYRIKSFALLSSIVEKGKYALDTVRYNLSNANGGWHDTMTV